MRLTFAVLLAGVASHPGPAPTATPQQPETVRVTVRLLDVRSEKGGVVRAGLHPAPGKGFPGISPLVNLEAVPSGSEVAFTFTAAPGVYAVAAHHDANNNRRMDANFIGIPKEGYGVSNDARPRFSAPKFEEAKVALTRDTTLLVRMAY
jgi:uncharacterized protein (DUF2141 family)